MDVHGQATVFCLLNAEGEVVERGSLPTTAPDLTKLIQRLSSIDTLLCGQEVGTMTYFVHDVVTSAGAKILSFNAQHLRMIAASRRIQPLAFPPRQWHRGCAPYDPTRRVVDAERALWGGCGCFHGFPDKAYP